MSIIRRTVVGASTLGLIASLLTGAFANGAELPKRSVLTLEAAQRVVQAAKKEAADHSWACVIAVVDGEGLLVTVVRMDNAAVAAEEEERSVSKPIVSAGSVGAPPLVFDATPTKDAAAEVIEGEESCSA
jgi:hypothetical protein